jgi:hypothetical protein
MTEPKDLLLVNEHLRRSNRRWKALALAACSVLLIMVVGIFVVATWERMRFERRKQALIEALERDSQARLEAPGAVNPPPPR